MWKHAQAASGTGRCSMTLPKYEVDLIGGDANASMYRVFSTQRTPSIGQSSFCQMLRKFIKTIIRVSGDDPRQNFTNIRRKIGADFVSSSSAESLLEFKNQIDLGNGDQISCDTMIAVVIGWGHNVDSKLFRDETIFKNFTARGRFSRDFRDLHLLRLRAP